jgi:hypothetical protein
MMMAAADKLEVHDPSSNSVTATDNKTSVEKCQDVSLLESEA